MTFSVFISIIVRMFLRCCNCLFYCLLLFVFGCKKNQKKDGPPLFTLMDSTGIDFVNTVEDDKLDNSFLFRNFYNGGGVAIGDINNDGLADIFLTSNKGANKLYLNKGNFKFDDISKTAGIIEDDKWNTGVVFTDINADGWLDIYVCSSGNMRNGNRKNKLYINNQNETFKESAAAFGLDISAYTTQVSFFDYDMDGDLDCFMINNSPIPVNQLGFANRRDLPDKDWPVADFLKGGGDHLFRNDNGKFKEVTKEAGLHGSLISFGLGVSVGDINCDGYPDVFVSNDSYERDYLYINQKDGTFKDEIEDWMQHMSFSSMGADIADINNDGYPELFTTDMLPVNDLRLKTIGAFDNIDLFNSKMSAGFYYQYVQNCLHLNNQNGTFSDIANYSGVAATDWSWGALMFDMDNDGWNDLYVCNGVNRDVTNLDFMDFFADETYHKMVMTGKKSELDQILKEIPRTPLANKVYRNDKNLRFTDVGDSWGLDQPTFSNGAAYGDLDNDGDLDLVINNENQPSFVYRNNAREINKNNFVTVRLTGKQPNLFAIGSRVVLYCGKQVLTREIVPSRGFQSSVDYKLVFGLGDMKVDSMLIIWPDRTIKKVDNVPLNKVLSFERDAENQNMDALPAQTIQPLFTRQQSSFGKHTENDHIDFYIERNIPRMLSKEGPKAAVGDVNGDGMEDVFITGTNYNGSHLYLQTAAGFVEKSTPALKQYADFEDVACLFFDCDNDGDLDLFVGAGGNIAAPKSRELQHRLYLNDGKGNFTIDLPAFPINTDNTSVVVANDFDNDGDLDLFVGARNVTQQYGTSPLSHIYINDGKGRFTEMDQSKTGGLSYCGMVTGAVWADVAGDKNKELIVVGEWMDPQVYGYSNGRFERLKNNLSGMFGWWQTIAATDVNGDGKTDLVIGNVGENCYLHADSAHPVKLWLNDFDQNNIMDKVLTNTVDGKDMPVFLKRELTDQVPGLKKKNLHHGDYALQTIQDLFTKEQLDAGIKRTFNYTSSCVAINEGNGNFVIQKLPARMQLSAVTALLCKDINNDGGMDIVSGGNLSCFLPQFERLDASYGDVLMNNGKGNFTWMGSKYSGIQQRGDVKDITSIKGKDADYILVLQNNDYPILYRRNITQQLVAKSSNH